MSSLERQLMHKQSITMDRVLRTYLQQQSRLVWRQIFGEAKASEIQQSCLLRGIWSTNKNQTAAARKGVTVISKNVNHLNNIAAARRSSTPAKQNRRRSGSKQVDENQIGRLCATETPEGEMCGNARFQAIGSTVSNASSSKVLRMYFLFSSFPSPLCSALTCPISRIWFDSSTLFSFHLGSATPDVICIW